MQSTSLDQQEKEMQLFVLLVVSALIAVVVGRNAPSRFDVSYANLMKSISTGSVVSLTESEIRQKVNSTDSSYLLFQGFAVGSPCTGETLSLGGMRFGACVPVNDGTGQMSIDPVESAASLSYTVCQYATSDCSHAPTKCFAAHLSKKCLQSDQNSQLFHFAQNTKTPWDIVSKPGIVVQ